MNKKESRETTIQSKRTEPLADLPLTTEQAEEAKAGRTGGGDSQIDLSDLNNVRNNFGVTI